MTKLRRLGIVSWMLLFSPALFCENDIYFSKIGIENGLSQLSVMTIYQDELGSLWFGTREGVNRYNGNEVEVFQPQPNDSNSLVGSLIKNICGDHNGHVFIHSQNGVNEYNLRTQYMQTILRGRIDAITYGVNHLWIAENNKLFIYNRKGGKEFFTEIRQAKSPIRVILQTADQRFIIGTGSSGVFIMDPNRQIRMVISDCSQVSDLFEDRKGNIWVGTWEKGLYKIDRVGQVVNYRAKKAKPETTVSSNFVRAICEDNRGFIWIGTKKGLDRLNVETEIFEHYNSDEYSYRQLSNESVWSLLKDSQGTIWVGTYFGGVNYFNPNIDFYTFHDLNNGVFRNKFFPIISNIIEDKHQHLFLCTEGNGLIYYNPADKSYINFRTIEGNSNSLTNDNIKSVYYDADREELWLGLHLGGICCLNLHNRHFTQYPSIHPKWEQSDIVRAIVPYGEQLLVATYNGLFLFDKKNGQFKLFSPELHKKVSYLVDLKLDKEGNFWIASNGLYCYHPDKGELESYSYQKGDSTSVSNNNITKILVDSRQRVWVATNGGGVNLFQPKKKAFIRYNSHSSGLKNDYVSNLLETRLGNLIITTTHGFSILDVKNNKITNYGMENGFPFNSFFNGGMCLTSSGIIYMAGMNGMISFKEENLFTQHRSFNLNLLNLWINNHPVQPGDKTGVLKAALPYTQQIDLHHNQSMITIEFATNNYIQTNQPMFRYRLEGFSNQWTDLPQGVNKLTFMNLNPGKYKLLVEGFFPSDGTAIARTDLAIRIHPPFYKTWYAYLFYVLLISFLVWRYIAFVRSGVLLEASLEYEKKEKQHIEEVNQSKLRFFTNISHEFRTPLTLIKGQVDMLLQMHNLTPTVYNRILNIKRNALNMQNLINELLEFRKIEQGYLAIRVSKNDLVKFIYEIYLSFSEYAHYRQIKFDFECEHDEIFVWFDAVQMQKVFYNLISNAFKFTPKAGTISIKIEQDSDTVDVKIQDSGIGISTEDIHKIFDRFYQAENGLNINSITPGTGIGLALTQNILDLHSAKINVESQLQVGSCFTVTLKKGLDHFTKEQLEESDKIENFYHQQLEELDAEFMREVIHTQFNNNKQLFSMLIVEDNDELREMLKNIFEPIYKIYTACDGEEGLNMTLELQPDIVLSDLMMPKMSGSELCSKIKSNFLVCHIPVVLLTAQTALEYNIESLRLGADDYITKPFNVKMLITRCNNLVNGRRLLQEKFSKQTEFSPLQIATNNMDREFLEKAQAIIEAHLDDNDFDIPTFSTEMAIGRTKLFNKIKGITGQTPNEFILTVKLKKAAELLSKNLEYNISDITYMLGFSSPKYFTKCFKDQFGVSPSVFRKDIFNTEGEINLEEEVED